MDGQSEMSVSILHQVAQGESGAVEECLRRYGDVVWSLARRFSASAQDAEDAVQEIFLNLWRSAGRFDASQGSEITFIVTIARRRLIDRLRARERQPRVDALDEIQPPSHDTSVPDRLETVDEAQQVKEVIDQLRPEQRDVLLRTLVGGQTQQEVADATGMPLGTVKSHARRGLHQVRRMMGLDPDGNGGAS